MPKLRPPLCARLLYGGLLILAWGTLAMWVIGGGLLMLAWGEFLGIAELGLIGFILFGLILLTVFLLNRY